MSNFKDFKNNIKTIGGVWDSKNVYFNQFYDGYSAKYAPNYPNGTTNDMIIQSIDNSGAYKRGNYELTIFKENKYTCIYFNNIDELIEYFNK